MFTARVILPTVYNKIGATELSDLVNFYDKIRNYITKDIISAAIKCEPSSFKILHMKESGRNRFVILSLDFNTIQQYLKFYQWYSAIIGGK